MERDPNRDARSRSAILGEARLELADDFWFIAHDHVTGALRLHAQALKCGLAGCLLAELLLSGWVTMGSGVVSAVDQRPVAPDDLTTLPNQPEPVSTTGAVWNQIVREPWRHTIRTWLTVLGEEATVEMVRARLAAAGHLSVHRSWRGGARAEPTSWHVADLPAARLRGGLQRQHQLSWQDLFLLTLVEAAGLNQAVLDGLAPPARAYHAHLLDSVAHHYPAVVELAAQTKTAIASGVLTRGHG